MITPIPPALLSTPIRNPPGSGCWVSTAAVSAMSAPPRHGITPACANRAETPTLPPTDRPATTASSGLRSANRRAVRANFSALPNDSRYSAATVTVSSSPHAASRSLLDTSSLAPSDANECTPTPWPRARSRTVNPTPPDWVATASPPDPGNVRAKDALRAPSGPRAMTPWEFGPTSRTLCARQSASRSRPVAVCAPPVSPDDTTTAAPTPAAQASVITSGTWSAGTTTTTRSRGPGTAETEAYAGTPSTASASGCTTLSRPAYPPDLIASRTARPSPPPWRRTPTTATLAGASRGRSERASERHSRRSAASSAAADTSVRSSTDTSPSAVRRETANPAPRNTRSMP